MENDKWKSKQQKNNQELHGSSAGNSPEFGNAVFPALEFVTPGWPLYHLHRGASLKEEPHAHLIKNGWGLRVTHVLLSSFLPDTT